MGDPHPLFLTADGSAGAYGKGLGLISLNSGLPRSCCRLQWSNLNLTRPIAILLFGDSNDRKLVVSAAATLGMTHVWPSPLGNCTSADGSVKVDETAQRRNDQCPVYGKGMLVLAHFPLDGTVLYMDEGGDPNAKLTPNEYPSMRHNTTGPALRAKRNLESWLGRPPDLITVHSSLRDVYSMCRKAAPGKPERDAIAAFAQQRPPPSGLIMPEAEAYLTNLHRIVRLLQRRGGDGQSGTPQQLLALRTMPLLHMGAPQPLGRGPRNSTPVPARDEGSLTNGCLRPPVKLNGLIAQFNALTRLVARRAGLMVFDWAEWLTPAMAGTYEENFYNGPHLNPATYSALAGAMLEVFETSRSV